MTAAPVSLPHAELRERLEDACVRMERGASAPARKLIREAAAQIATLERERQASDEQIDALCAKIQSLAPHGTCGCSYDKPDDICDHHSPALAAVKAENARLTDLNVKLTNNFNTLLIDNSRWEDRTKAAESTSALLREALTKLAAEVAGLPFVVSAALGNTNWSVLMLRLDEARAALKGGSDAE